MSSLLLFPLKVLLIGLDLAITLVTFGWINALKKLVTPEPMRTVALGDDESHRVHADYKAERITTPREGINSLYDLQKDAFQRYASRDCMKTREYLGQHTPKVKKFGGIKSKTFEQVGVETHKFGAALCKVGMVAAPKNCTLKQIVTPCSLAIFENTCSEWMSAALGAFSQSMSVTTIYATLGIESVVLAVNDGNISTIVCNKRNVKVLLDSIKSMKTLKTIVYTSDMIAPNEEVEFPASPKGIKVFSFEEFVETGDVKAFPPVPATPQTCAVIMYTSGSTGTPKGVVITHANLVAIIASSEISLGIKEGSDVYLAYLPLAHILELMAEFIMISMGCTLCYADPKTLTATGAYPIGALEQYSPTMMAAVPKIWDVIKKGVQAKIAATSPVAQFLVNTAFEARTFAINHGYDTPLFNALVFKKFKKVVGGKLRLALSGGGPLNKDVQVFIRTCFGCPLFQGYGLTETAAGVSIQDPSDLRCGVAGVPVPSVEVKLESTPEITDKGGMPYLNTDCRDVEGNPVFGRGEIMVSGPSVALGYYMMEDKTKEEFRADGFFHTGDIGQFLSDGSIRIVDRKKNLVKLMGGEYIAIENMEMVYGNSTFVDAVGGGICCYGDGDMDRPIAIMQLNPVTTMKWAASQGIEGDFEKVKESKELMDAVMADLMKEWKAGGLSHLEKVKAVALLTEHWTPENGCLTAANKLQRRMVISMFEKEFDEVRAKGIFH
mmetsp:Transcript_15724/g.28610  ORF Transcript_15724/g.28610 Transcript_15724/m.28610 type:complete len:722 (-) Transcript_15724:236-2401(-)|eukprot:CAMPEP_0198286868 /NCGR_PEP_ID=MMETSP1449-20131203/5823_1 /TAXON_ID=420275 /ORGANISM="Attheya septentrionalis, Strain CCMP2084" /LENGTH=721 /DNA_ID=CAMNT_0043984695 /DNA_START=115 /DNA_END=2280 /DNA_ORIENTATION=+